MGTEKHFNSKKKPKKQTRLPSPSSTALPRQFIIIDIVNMLLSFCDASSLMLWMWSRLFIAMVPTGRSCRVAMHLDCAYLLNVMAIVLSKPTTSVYQSVVLLIWFYSRSCELLLKLFIDITSGSTYNHTKLLKIWTRALGAFPGFW